MNVRLMIEKSKVNSAGLAKIYVELTFRDSEKVLHTLRLPTGERTVPEAWKGQKVTAKHGEGHKALIKRIQRKQAEVQEYLSLHPQATKQQIKDHFAGKRRVQHTFFDLFQRFIEFQETRIKAESLKPTRTTQTELKKLLPAKADVTCIGYDLFESYYTYLHGRGLKLNTIITRLKKLRGFCNYLSDKGIIEDTTYKKFKIGDYKEGKMVSLTMEELEHLFQFDLINNQRLDRVRDILLLTCVTGLRHSDAAKVRPHHIVRGTIIKIYLDKPDEEHAIPLMRISKAILAKYNNDLSCLKISNAKYNEYLKELAEKAGIRAKVTVPDLEGGRRVYRDVPKYSQISSHVGRKTFCTLSLELGMREEMIMKISGHKDRRSFQKYLNLTDKLKEKAMGVWDDSFGALKVGD